MTFFQKGGSCFRKPTPLIRHREKYQFFFQNFFYEYLIKGIEPPFPLSKSHIWGGYGRGEGGNNDIGPHAKIEGGE